MLRSTKRQVEQCKHENRHKMDNFYIKSCIFGLTDIRFRQQNNRQDNCNKNRRITLPLRCMAKSIIAPKCLCKLAPAWILNLLQQNN